MQFGTIQLLIFVVFQRQVAVSNAILFEHILAVTQRAINYVGNFKVHKLLLSRSLSVTSQKESRTNDRRIKFVFVAEYLDSRAFTTEWKSFFERIKALYQAPSKWCISLRRRIPATSSRRIEIKRSPEDIKRLDTKSIRSVRSRSS